MTSRVRTRPERAALRRARAFGDSLREWLHDRAVAAEKRRRERLLAEQARPRGVDRVPDRLRVATPEPRWIHQHNPVQHPLTGRWVKGLPYVNPNRAARLAQRPPRRGGTRLRKDLP